ncbi:MAG: hypothetical protein JNM63_08600, partial [Spirochaetia bacterium]|nr:hypothetical protein [Spirochaetia bacterium]
MNFQITTIKKLALFAVLAGASFGYSDEPGPVPVELANAGFEAVKEKKIEGWQVYAWSRPVEGTTVEASGGAQEGQSCVAIS